MDRCIEESMDLLRDGEMDGCSNRQTYRHIQTDKDAYRQEGGWSDVTNKC